MNTVHHNVVRHKAFKMNKIINNIINNKYLSIYLFPFWYICCLIYSYVQHDFRPMAFDCGRSFPVWCSTNITSAKYLMGCLQLIRIPSDLRRQEFLLLFTLSCGSFELSLFSCLVLLTGAVFSFCLSLSLSFHCVLYFIHRSHSKSLPQG